MIMQKNTLWTGMFNCLSNHLLVQYSFLCTITSLPYPIIIFIRKSVVVLSELIVEWPCFTVYIISQDLFSWPIKGTLLTNLFAYTLIFHKFHFDLAFLVFRLQRRHHCCGRLNWNLFQQHWKVVLLGANLLMQMNLWATVVGSRWDTAYVCL